SRKHSLNRRVERRTDFPRPVYPIRVQAALPYPPRVCVAMTVLENRVLASILMPGLSVWKPMQ
ncbi:MAG: hypothetical protein OEY45_03445, partial [Gammaproteobacteria bacterium]|nr:hypothetical protein [Gammaproteobacteria bacterium]